MKKLVPLALGAGLLFSALGTAPAFAGSCPAGQMKDGARTSGETMPKGVTDTVLTSIDLAKEPANIAGRQLRLRRLVVQPGGIVPWHSHATRPAIIHVVSGTIEEYASNCAVPVLHKAGESVAEKSPVSHWWKNTGTKPAELLSADLFPAAADAHMM